MKIFTCSVFPHLTRIWYHNLRAVIGNDVEVHIYDCNGNLDKLWVPNAVVTKYPNKEHGKKINHFVQSNPHDLILVTDDDAFILHKKVLNEIVSRHEHSENLAVVSLHNNHSWKMKINGQQIFPFGTYSFMIKPDIFLLEKLGFESITTSDKSINNASGYFDTGNFAHMELLKRGYQVDVVSEEETQLYPTLFATSSGFMTFYKKNFLTGKFVRKWSREKIIEESRAYDTIYQRVCNMVFIRDLYDEIFGDDNLKFPVYMADVLEIMAESPQKSIHVNRPRGIIEAVKKNLSLTV